MTDHDRSGSTETSRRDMLKLGGAVALGGVAATVLSAGPAMAVGTGGPAVTSNRFSVEIDGVIVAGVHTVDGIETEGDVHDVNDAAPSPKSPHLPRTGKFTVTKDWSNTKEWYQWRKAIKDGHSDLRSISVIFHNDAGEETGRMNFYSCWPSKWVGPRLDASVAGTPDERLDIHWDTLELKTG
jgi:phage tail-like protein